MTLTPEQIEWVVAEVVRRLTASSSAPTNTADLRLNDKVVTLKSIENKLNGISRVLVAPRAIVTAAAKDQLKDRKIELVRQ